MNKKHWICICITLVNYLCFAQNQTPNFIIFIADDVSWNDFSCYGNVDVQTPNIDKLAKDGLKFTNVYLTSSSCSPSRNSIMTGRYPHNTGAAELHTEPPIKMLSFPEVLKNNNYFTMQAGKFHMGKYAKRGFNISYDDKDNGNGGEKKWLKSVKERPLDKPFFMWFAAFDAHRPWGTNEFSGAHAPSTITTPSYLARKKNTKKDLAQYYDEIKRFDYHIGTVVKELKKQKVLNNTVIIIMADNGRPFPHSKTRVNDRGMKTPFIVHWPNQISKNKESISLISAIDIAPTIMSLAKIEIPDQFQGYSFENILKRPKKRFRNYIFSEHNWHDYEAHERMVRNEDFLYILNSRPLEAQTGPADAVGSPSFKDLLDMKEVGRLSAMQADIFLTPRPKEELYNISEDPLQLLNIASDPKYKTALIKMRNVLRDWMRETSDNIPDKITKDWYTKTPNHTKTNQFKVRGEMPGTLLNATQNNNKGKF